MLEASCRRYWWRKAVMAAEGTVRYGRFRKEVTRLANGLSAKAGVAPGEKVALLLNNSLYYPQVFFSVLNAGGVVVPLNTFLKGDELKYIINQSDAKVLFTSAEFYPLIKEILPELKWLRQVVLIGEKETGADCLSLRELTAGVNTAPPPNELSPDAVAVIIYTSGTTGFPKGAMLTHANLLANLKSCAQACRISCRDRVVIVLPMFHSFTMTVCMLLPLFQGAGMVVIKSLHNFKKVFQRMLLCKVTMMIGIPPLYNLLAKAKVPRIVRILLRLRLCISGAAPLAEQTLNDFEQNWRLPLLEGYGLSEASPVVSLNPLAGVRKINSVGLALSTIEVKIVGPDESEVPTGKVGEIIVKGPNVMAGYYKNEQATAETIRGGWLFTGDLGYLDSDGYLFIVDRKKDMILVRGLNVYPREVEQVLRSRPGIAEVSVVGRPDPARGEVPVAFVIPRNGKPPDVVELTRHCRQHLADYKVPRQIIIAQDLPRTPTGKILKRELKKLLVDKQ